MSYAVDDTSLVDVDLASLWSLLSASVVALQVLLFPARHHECREGDNDNDSPNAWHNIVDGVVGVFRSVQNATNGIVDVIKVSMVMARVKTWLQLSVAISSPLTSPCSSLSCLLLRSGYSARNGRHPQHQRLRHCPTRWRCLCRCPFSTSVVARGEKEHLKCTDRRLHSDAEIDIHWQGSGKGWSCVIVVANRSRGNWTAACLPTEKVLWLLS